MTYFKILSIVLGAAMVLGGLWIILGVETWKKFLVKLYPEKRPLWVNLTGLGVLVIVVWTWCKFLAELNAYAFVVTFVVSLSLLKVLLLSFFYKKYRELVFGLMGEPVALRVVVGSSVAIGAALLMIGFLF